MDRAADQIVHEALPEDQEVRELEFEVAFQTELYFEYALTLEEEVLHEAQAQSDIIYAASAKLEEQLAGEPELLDLLTRFEDEYDEFAQEAEVFASLYAAGDTLGGLRIDS
jgi:hypothetical protein